MAEISVFDPKMIVWVEMGSDTKCSRSYGYSLRGMCAVNHVLRVGGIAAMSVDGVEDIYIGEGNVNGDVVEDCANNFASFAPTQAKHSAVRARLFMIAHEPTS